MPNILGSYFLEGAPVLRSYRSKRISSYDRTGGNADFVSIEPGKTKQIAEIKGPGCIKHIWITINAEDKNYLRTTVLRMFWDDEENPSVETPIGDFFGVGHARAKAFQSLPLNMVTGGGVEEANQAAMNCFFPMPFRQNARIEIQNESKGRINSFYYYIDYEEHDYISKELANFHACWGRENPTRGYHTFNLTPHQLAHEKCNLTGNENYVILDAEGHGHYVGCVVSIDNVQGRNVWHTWFGEGDDMIFIDDEPFPPSLHGTGTEDYFCAAWGFPSGACSGLFHGISLAGNPDYTGKWSIYRFHLESPIAFTKSIRVTIEHGHDNNRSDDWSSVAFWYQTEPHKKFPPLPSAEQRLPRP
jgi:hypothetical protein